MSIIRHSAWAAAAALVLAGSRFVFVAIIARRLSITEFGQYAYGQWLGDFIFLLCSLGATGVIGRYLAEFRHQPGVLVALARHWRPFALGLPLLAAALVPLGVWVSGLSIEPVAIALLALWTLVNGFWAMQTAALSGLQRFDLIFFANVIAAVVLVAGALFMPLDGQGLGGLFGLMSLASACAVMIGYAATRRLTQGAAAALAPAQRRTMYGYAINIWLTALLWSLVWSRGEMPVVRAYLGDEGVAHYAAALTLFGGAIQAVMLATAGVAPQLTRLWGEGSQVHAVALARQLMDLQLLLCGLAAVLLIYFSPELMHLAFGGGYRGESGNLAVLSLGLVAMAVSCQSHLLQIDTDGRFSRNSTLIGLIILLGSAMWLVSVIGLLGAAMARAVTMLLMAVVCLWAVRRRWGTDAYSWGNVASVVSLVTICIAIQNSIADLPWLVRVGLSTLACMLLVAAVRDVAGRMQAGVVLVRLRHEIWPDAVTAKKWGQP